METVRLIGKLLLRLTALQKNPFLLHVVVEIPASLNFLLYPGGQLRTYSPQAHPVIRQYAVLLLSTILIALSFASRSQDELSGQVAGALALYHLAPMLRATGRLRGDQAVWEPLLFLASHGICLAGFIRCFWGAYASKFFATQNDKRISGGCTNSSRWYAFGSTDEPRSP